LDGDPAGLGNIVPYEMNFRDEEREQGDIRQVHAFSFPV
jgi:hypothetical protein